MKKALTILMVLILVIGAAFAATQRLTLQSDVDLVDPAFVLYGSLDASNLGATVSADAKKANTNAAFNGNLIGSPLSIADNDITVYFAIYQEGETKDNASINYARSKKTASLSVTVGPLTEQSPKQGATAATANGYIIESDADDPATYEASVDGVVIGQQANAVTITTPAIAENAKISTTTFSAVYNGKSVDQRVGTFTAKWLKNTTVPNGTYMADITLTYTVQ